LADGSGTYILDKLDQVVTELGFAEYTTQKRLSTMNMFAYTMSLMIGTAGLPHVIIRFFTVPKVADARRSAGWALVFIAILYTTAPAVAAMARLNLMETIQPKEKNEMVKVDRDIMVLANPEIAKLPNWVIALVAAGGLAAALSTAAGLLLAISSAISHDLMKGIFTPDMSEKNELLAGRIAMAAAIALAGYLGYNPPDFAAGTVALAFGLAASSIFPALMMGIFNKKMNKEGAICGMIAGISVTLLYVFQHKGIMFVKSTSFLGDSDPNWFLGIEPNAFGFIGAIVNFAVAIIVSKMTAAPPAHIQDLVEDIRVPKGSTTIGGAH